MTEELRSVPGFPGYFVTSSGDVYTHWVRGSHPRRIGLPWKMKPKRQKSGHLSVALFRQKEKPEYRRIHRLILESWLGPCPPGLISRHLNGDPTDNRIENLAYGTKAENYSDSISHGTANIGERQYKAKLTNQQVREIRRLANSGVRHRLIGSQFGVSRGYVARIVCREIWKHVV